MKSAFYLFGIYMMRITKTPFFQAGISSSREQAQKAIEEQLKRQIDKAWNNT